MPVTKLIRSLALFVVVIVIINIVTTMNAHAKRLHHEKWYQERWCNAAGGQTEFVLSDRSRVDCLTATHAIEFDFADKWAESGFQSLYYAMQTNKVAGIVLIVESEKDYKHWIKLNSVIEYNKLPIKTWLIKP